MDILDENPTVALICNMSVIKEKRGQGYGNKLLKACEKDAMKRTKVTSIELWADSGSIAYEWYKRQGYVLTEEWQVITRKVFLVKLKKELEK